MAYFFIIVLLSGLVPLVIYLIHRRRLYGIGRKGGGVTGADRKKPAFMEVLKVFSKRLSKDRTAAILHHLIVFGSILLATGMIGKPIFRGEFWRNIFTPNIAAAGKLMILIASIAFAARRLNGKVRRLTKEPKDMLPLIILGTFILFSFFQEGLTVALNGENTASSFISGPISLVFVGLPSGQLRLWADVCNAVFGLSLLALLLTLFRSKMFHIFAGFFNFSAIGSFQLGRLNNTENEIHRLLEGAPDAQESNEMEDESHHFGIKYIDDLDQIHLSQLDGCVECGRCDEACPAFLSGKALSPRKLILGQKAILNQYDAQKKTELIQNEDEKEIVWSCNLCYACENACPAMVQHVDGIVGLRRNLVLNDGETLKDFKEVLQRLGKTGNPFGIKTEPLKFYRKLNIPILSQGESVDYLLWLGCYGMIDERMAPVVTKLVRLLKDAGKTFGVLGENAICCGDPARRIGDEYLFQTILNRNISLFKQYNITEVLTLCPHCMNTFKNEYPTFGAQIKTKHYVEILPELYKPNHEANPNPKKKKVFYHDSCYLARINHVGNEPRQILEQMATVELVTINEEKDDSLCCGGGGGRIWVDEPLELRPSAIKLTELREKQVEMVITSCPYCLSVYSDTSAATKAGIEVKDLLEIVK